MNNTIFRFVANHSRIYETLNGFYNDAAIANAINRVYEDGRESGALPDWMTESIRVKSCFEYLKMEVEDYSAEDNGQETLNTMYGLPIIDEGRFQEMADLFIRYVND